MYTLLYSFSYILIFMLKHNTTYTPSTIQIIWKNKPKRIRTELQCLQSKGTVEFSYREKILYNKQTRRVNLKEKLKRKWENYYLKFAFTFISFIMFHTSA